MTNEQMRQRIAELEDALKPMSDAWNKLQTDGGLNDPERPSHGTGTIKQKHLRRAASLLTAPPPDSEPDADAVERVAKAISPYLMRSYSGTNPDVDDQARGRDTAMHVAKLALSAIRPAIDREKLAEIRERHDYCAHVATKTEWEDEHAWKAHDDRAWLLSVIEGVNHDD